MSLLIMSGIAALLFILYALLRAISGRKGVPFLSPLLALITLVLVTSYALQQQTTELNILPLALIVVIAGIIIFSIEKLRARTGWNDSLGVLTIGMSILLLITMVLSPILKTKLLEAASVPITNNAETTPESGDLATESSVALASNTQNNQPETTPTATQVVPSQTPLPIRTLANPLPTRYVYATPAPVNGEATETTTDESESVVVGCEAVVENNLNLRGEPSPDGELLLTIPHASMISVYARNADGSWLDVRYEDQRGWVNADFVTLNTGCMTLPVRDAQ